MPAQRAEYSAALPAITYTIAMPFKANEQAAGRYEKSGMPPGRRCACPAQQCCNTEAGADLILDAVFLRRCSILSKLGF